MGAETQSCRSCGAPVVFARHSRTAPLERDPAGRFTVVHPNYFLASPNIAAEHRWTNHFARCSGAARHRSTTTTKETA
jgi:hypothetical protein